MRGFGMRRAMGGPSELRRFAGPDRRVRGRERETKTGDFVFGLGLDLAGVHTRVIGNR